MDSPAPKWLLNLILELPISADEDEQAQAREVAQIINERFEAALGENEDLYWRERADRKRDKGMDWRFERETGNNEIRDMARARWYNQPDQEAPDAKK